MVPAYAMVRAFAARFFADDAAQDTFEYVLIIGGVVVAVVVAVATPVGSSLINAVVAATCTTIKTVLTGISCA